MKQLFVFLTAAMLLASSVSGDDIGLVSIKNDFQAHVAEATLGQAYTRVGDQFLASISPTQADVLSRAGLNYEIVLSDTDPAATYLIYQPGKRDQRQAPAGSIEIGMGLRLAQSRPSGERGFGKAVLLQDLSVHFFYETEAIEGFLSSVLDFPSDSLVDLVDADSVYAFDVHLEDFGTRYIWADEINDARDWMVQKFLDWGYTDVTTPEFQYDGGWHYNVMAVKPGVAEPDKVIVIGGHYDSITYGVAPGPLVYAPGADDNASGTVVMLELARILADIPLRKTVVFMAFSAEEVGLVGSGAAARQFYEDGTDVEVMFNYDMVAHDPNNYWQIDLSSGTNTSYRQITYDAAQRVTPLSPRNVAMGSSSDHYSFHVRGFDVVHNIETDFNDLGWHTNEDVSTRLNFPYFTDVVKMATAAMGVVANSAHPTEIAEIVDQGDGQSLEVFWTGCDPTYTYTLNYGTSPGYLPNSIAVPAGQCSYVVSGLTEGVPYYFSAVGEVAGAYPPAWVGTDSASSLVMPRTPHNLTIEPALRELGIHWNRNREADLSHYRVYRDDGGGLTLFQDNVTDTMFVDTDVEALVEYTYQITAFDLDLNESGYSNAVSGIAYTFDQGILLVDETADDPYLPPQAEQEAFFDSCFAGITYALDTVQAYADTLPRQKAGPYSSIIWLDDDVMYKDIHYNESTIEWFLSYPTDMFIGGFQTITRWEESPITGGHVLYEEFGIKAYTQNDVNDFCGAIGQDGWPSVTLDTNNLWKGKFPYIPALEERIGATVIYTYDSFTDNPTFEGEPCGLLYETANGKRIVLAFPVYWLTAESSEALIARVAAEFGYGTAYVYGDADGNEQVDLLDLDFLVDYLYREGPAPTNENAGDVNGSCQLDILDLEYLVNYLFLAGPDPGPGCVF